MIQGGDFDKGNVSTVLTSYVRGITVVVYCPRQFNSTLFWCTLGIIIRDWTCIDFLEVISLFILLFFCYSLSGVFYVLFSYFYIKSYFQNNHLKTLILTKVNFSQNLLSSKSLPLKHIYSFFLINYSKC